MSSEKHVRIKEKSHVARFLSQDGKYNDNNNTKSKNIYNSKEHVQMIDMTDSEVSPLSPDTGSMFSINKLYMNEETKKLTSLPSLPSFINRDFNILKPHRSSEYYFSSCLAYHPD